MSKKELLDRSLAFDALADAEKITGESYKTDKRTEMLGLGMFFLNNQLKEAMLLEAGDTPFSCEFNKQLAIALHEGFKVVLHDTFISNHKGDNGIPYNETYMILWNPEGFLMTLESYRETSRNTAKLLYNLDLKEHVANKGTTSGITSSGSFVFDTSKATKENRYGENTYIWSGDHDAREGFRRTLGILRSANPLPIWKNAPFLWLVNYAESNVDGYDYNAITNERIARLPQDVQDAIKGDPQFS